MKALYKRHRFLAVGIYILAALFLCYEMALQVSPVVITQELMKEFSIGAAGLGILSSFYFYSYTLMQIPAGLLYDHYPARYLISFSCFICTLGAFFFAMSNNVVEAALGRFFMGIGSAFAFIGVLLVAAHWFKPNAFAFLVGIAQLLAAIGAAAGVVPIAAMVGHMGWRQTLVLFAIFGMVLSIFCFSIIREPKKEKNLYPEESLLSLRHKLKEILTHGQTWWIGLFALTSWGPVVIFAALWGVPFLMQLYGISKLQAAIATAMIWIGIGVTSPILGWMSDKIGRRCLLLKICSLVGLGSSLLVVYGPVLPYILLCFFLLLIGFASSAQILTFALIKDNNRHSMTGTAIGLNNMAVVAGGALFQPLVGGLLLFHWQGLIEQGLPYYANTDYRFALWIIPLCYGIGAVTSFFLIKETYCKPKYSR